MLLGTIRSLEKILKLSHTLLSLDHKETLQCFLTFMVLISILKSNKIVEDFWFSSMSSVILKMYVLLSL